jgi:hypothetical protein
MQAAVLALAWKKSSFCPNAASCVEVAALPGGGSAMRDGKDPASPRLLFDADQWTGFLTAARSGEFDPRE